MLDAVRHIWTLSEGGEESLGLSCTEDGLFLGRTSLFDLEDGRFVPRRQVDLERLMRAGFGIEGALDHVMLGLSAVASALNEDNLCRASIAAVHLRIPPLPDVLARLAIETQDALIKVEDRSNHSGSSNWDPAKHPRAGTGPNPGWFAPAGDTSDVAPMPLSAPQGGNAPQDPSGDDRVTLPPGDRIDELGDLLEWIANAKPEDEQAIRQEIKRLYYDVGDVQGGNMMNMALTDALEPGLSRHDREELLAEFEPYTRSDPAEVAQLGRDLTTGALLFPRGAEIAAPSAEAANAAEAAGAEVVAPAAEATAEAISDVWTLGWARRGVEIEQALGKNLGPTFPVIDSFEHGVATSIKSIDLTAATYQDTGRLLARLNKYSFQLSKFNGAKRGQDIVRGEEITSRVLDVAVPKISLTAEQRTAIEMARAQAKQYGVTLNIIPF